MTEELMRRVQVGQTVYDPFKNSKPKPNLNQTYVFKIANDEMSEFEISTFNVDVVVIDGIKSGKVEALEELKKAYVKYLQKELAREDLKEND